MVNDFGGKRCGEFPTMKHLAKNVDDGNNHHQSFYCQTFYLTASLGKAVNALVLKFCLFNPI